jgi:uncharacterized protein
MVVISDTTAICNLFLIRKLWILEKLYSNIVIPLIVFDELLRLEESGHDISEIKNATWITIGTVNSQDLFLVLSEILDKGESAAIVLAKEQNADLLIIDEIKGRKVAQKLNIPIIGLIGILVQAKEQNVVRHIKPILTELQQNAGFWISKDLYQTALKLANEE